MTHEYLTLNGKVVYEKIGTGGTAKIMVFTYDAQGRPFAVKYSKDNGASFTNYFYALNLQGDVVKIFRPNAVKDANETIIGYTERTYATYSYNAWGELTGITDSNGNSILNKQTTSTALANLNPLRYRGYYYDNETGFYYLQSRYYDPANRRFINADIFTSTNSTDAVACNMFAYCGNNPVNREDPSGMFGFLAGLLLTAVVGAVVNVATSYVAAKVTGQEYSLTDGIVAAISGAANAIPGVGRFIAGGFSGGYAAYTAYKNGANTEEVVLNFAVASAATVFSIGNLADLGMTSFSTIAATATADLVFGTGYYCVSAATNKAIAQAAVERSHVMIQKNRERQAQYLPIKIEE